MKSPQLPNIMLNNWGLLKPFLYNKKKQYRKPILCVTGPQGFEP